MGTPTVEVKKTHEAFGSAPTLSSKDWDALEGNSLVKLGDGVAAQIGARVKGRMAAQYQREYNEAMARIDPKKVIKDRLTAKRAALITNQGTIDGFITSKLSQGVGHDEAEMMAMKYAGAMT